MSLELLPEYIEKCEVIAPTLRRPKDIESSPLIEILDKGKYIYYTVNKHKIKDLYDLCKQIGEHISK